MIEILLHRVWLFIWRLFTPATFIEFYTNVDNPSILTNYLFEVFESYIIMIIAYYIINELTNKKHLIFLIPVLILITAKGTIYALYDSLFLYIVSLLVINVIWPKFLKPRIIKFKTRISLL